MNDAKEVEIFFSWNFAKNFPQMGSDLIQRPHLLETIAEILEQNTVVFLEGGEGDGATTTLGQFCQKYNENTFSLFIKPISRFAYSVDYLRLILAEQFYWYVEGKSFDKASIDAAEYQSLLYKVRRKKKNQTLYMVVDGVHQIPRDDIRRAEDIFRDVLPLGMDNFKFIITGKQSLFSDFDLKFSGKPYQQMKFRPEESEQFLISAGLNKAQALEIHKVCKGVPGRVAVVKRLLTSGIEVEQILSAEPNKYLEFIELEFASLDSISDQEKFVIASIAFARRALTSNELAETCGSKIADIEAIFSKCTFLQVEEDNLQFVSESHRRFSEKKLENFQARAINSQIEFLLRNPSGEMALRFLPTYYQRLNQEQAIIDLISPEHYCRLFETTQSLSALKSRADIAIKSATELKEATAVFKFALQQSVFVAIDEQRAPSSEVSALVSLNQTDRALSVANRAVIKADRLALMATYAKELKVKGRQVDASLVNFIKELCSQIDFTEHPDKAVDIASDILFFEPDLAIQIVENANKRNKNPKEQDAALIRLSVTATVNKASTSESFGTKTGRLISDASLQKFNASLAAFTEHMPMSEVIQTADSMDASHRIFFLKSVVSVRRNHAQILDVVDYALTNLIKESAYTPKSNDLAELAKALTISTASIEKLDILIERFDAQIGLISQTAFSKDITLLQMRLAKAQMKVDKDKSAERILQAYYDVAAITTPEVQAECYSIMLNLLVGIDLNGELEAKHGLVRVIKTDLKILMDDILAHTSDHFSATEGIIRSIARMDETSALELVERLNVERRRDKAYGTIARIFSAVEFTDSRKVSIYKAIGRISDPSVKDDAILSVYKSMERNSDKKQWIGSLPPLIGMVKNIEKASECMVIDLKIKCGSGSEVGDVAELTKLIARLDDRLFAVDIGFSASSALASENEELSLKFFDEAQKAKDDLKLQSDSAVRIVLRCAYLVSRIYQPIIKHGLFDDEYLVRFCYLVESVPCAYSQIEIYSDLAARAYCAGRIDLNKRIVQERCFPLLNAAQKSGDQDLVWRIIRILFPVIRTFHSATAFDYLRCLPQALAEDALYESALFIIRKMAPTEPYHSMDFDNFQLESSDILDLYEIISFQTSDSSFYSTLSAATQAISSKINRTVFTAQQKTDFATKVQKIISKIIPDPKNITHIGYQLVSFAQLYRLKETSHSDWMTLVSDAVNIENRADLGYVYLEIAKCLPPKYEADRKKLLADALAAFDSIPSPIDRLSHYENYANVASKDSVNSAKEALRRAIVLSTEMDSNAKVEKHRRQLIDIADKIQPGLADELVELIDDDPARAQAKSEIKRSADLTRVKRLMANAKGTSEVKQLSKSQITQASWKNFAQLIVGRLETKPVEVMQQYLVKSCGESLIDSYGILTWYIENLHRKYNSRQDTEEHVLPLCEAIMLSSEMAVSVIGQAHNKGINIYDQHDINSGSFIVEPDQREKAIEFIRAWLNSNAEDYIKYCDPYFGPTDVSFLRLVLSTVPTCKVSVLTSTSHLKEKQVKDVDAFRVEWDRISDQEPPETEIIALGTESDGKAVFHDRWLLTKGAGLRIGTSYNSMGMSKVSEISELEPSHAATIQHNLDRYFSKQRLIEGKRCSYNTFDL